MESKTMTVALSVLLLLAVSGVQAFSPRNLGRSLLAPNATNGAKPTNGATMRKDDDDSVEGAVKFLKAANISVTNSTIFAPTDEALAELNKMLNLTANDYAKPAIAEAAAATLKLHVIPGKVLYSKDIPMGNTTLLTAAGKNITVTKKIDDDGDDKGEEEVYVKGMGNKKGAEVEKKDIAWMGNVVHVIDKVLLA